MSDEPMPAAVPATELEVARAVARRSGRPVFAVVDVESGRRRLAGEPPDEVAAVAYVVDRRGQVRYGPAGRPEGPPPGASLVQRADAVPVAELAAARDLALAAGATLFVSDPPVPRLLGADDLDDEDAEDIDWSAPRHGRGREAPRAADAGPAFAFTPPADGSLRYAVRPTGELLVGAGALAEPPRRVRDAGWTARVGATLRQVRRLRERGAGLAGLTTVDARAWSRVERLVPDAARDALRPGLVVGRPGREVAERVARAAEAEVERLRGEAGRLMR